WTRRGPRVHSGPRSGVSLEAPGNKRPLPFWVLACLDFRPQEAEDAEEEAFPSLVDRELVSGHVGPPASASADPGAPACPQDTKPSSTRIVSSVSPQSAPQSLDPRTLRLLWRQRELEIQALRWAIENHREARHCRILQEVAGLPAERSAAYCWSPACPTPPPAQTSSGPDLAWPSCTLCPQAPNDSEEEPLLLSLAADPEVGAAEIALSPRSSRSRKFSQNQVQKLTLELEEHKEQAQLEKAHLEERLLQTGNTLRQLEAELQALQKSCLLQLARSSWVGRMLRSSTGSVEVVTAETLMDPSDLSENDRSPTAGEGFRLEDVDWNSIAHRYPNLFTDLESSLDQKHPRAPLLLELPPATQPDQWNSEPYCWQREHRLKSVEWSSLPLVGASSSGGADSESSSCLLAARYHVQKVTGDPLQAPGHTAEQREAQAQSLCGDSRAAWAGGAASPWISGKPTRTGRAAMARRLSPVRIPTPGVPGAVQEARPGADLAEQQPLPRLPRKGRVQEARAGRRRPGWGPRLPQSVPPPQAQTRQRPQTPC
ncbi:hypothetical protein E2I00_019899, partial [Balaenoptera physalus]